MSDIIKYFYDISKFENIATKEEIELFYEIKDAYPESIILIEVNKQKICVNIFSQISGEDDSISLEKYLDKEIDELEDYIEDKEYNDGKQLKNDETYDLNNDKKKLNNYKGLLNKLFDECNITYY